MTELNHQEHSIILKDRKTLNLSGVSDVDSFSDQSITVQSVMGVIAIRGSGIKIENFSAETLNLSVTASDIYAVVYMNDKSNKSGFFARIFK